MTPLYYSIRMHADRDARHLCGAERLVVAEAVDAVSAELLARAMAHNPAAVSLGLDEVRPEQIVFGSLPDITLMPQSGYEQGRQQAVTVLMKAGVSKQSAVRAMNAIAEGASPAGFAMRGAMLVDADSGERLESDPVRGVRATRLDLTDAASRSLTALLEQNGLQHIRTREALVLAAKVMAAPGVVAELCWSDAADYTAGYVASQQTGYCRFTDLKPSGDLRGGRAFFVRPGSDLAATTTFLEQTPFLVDRHGGLHSWTGE